MSIKPGTPNQPIELWGGVECTVNRVRDNYFEQLNRSGHTRRIEDLDRFAELGITALRQPVIWECTCPGSIEDADWSWSDLWLTRLRELRINPIIGLVHHGSGPRHTNLLDPEFPTKLAAYATEVARRYPWVRDYTPVNEPLTTARFAALYGHWYPHRRDDLSFATALLNECRAVVLAMRAVRAVNPEARLVQTDDLGKVFSTPELRYQADFENERRWLTFDLLAGRVDERHAVWEHFLHWGVEPRALMWFAENSCPPDILGFNYYLSSERFIDHRIDLYPGLVRGGNGKHTYIDTEAARVRADGMAGSAELLVEAWQRFRVPIAITECHNGCTREEQLRWVLDVWHGACDAKRRGADVRALTLWSLLGAFDWNSLVTRNAGDYEPGVFDIRAPRPRPTALAWLGKTLAAGSKPEHPVLETPGWWSRPERLIHRFAVEHDGSLSEHRHQVGTTSLAGDKAQRPILITGGTGTLGRAFARACVLRGLPHRLLVRKQMDIADPRTVSACLDVVRPWAVINAAGYVRVDDAERDAIRCQRENVVGPAVLATECAQRGIRLVTFSSDLVFNGEKRDPYVESDAVGPLNAYGISKVLAERLVLERYPGALVVRTSAFFGPWDEYNFVTIALRNIAAGREFHAAPDAIVSPTYVPDLINASLDLLIDGAEGIWHLANAGALSWMSLAITAAEMKGFRSELVVPRSTSEFGWPAQRPVYSVLGSENASIMPSVVDALSRYAHECVIKPEETYLAA
ncbi:MAG TPA: sugar nucleotide-binding protein [Terriglobales bacterium]|nr:sugar nucleotide-binding protein [Terriglobales bacterium]